MTVRRAEQGPPLDEEDGAARVLDLVATLATGVRGARKG